VANEPKGPNVLREEWIAFLFVGMIFLVVIGAGVMLLLSALGFWHLRRVSPEAEVLPHLGARTPAPVEL
jgi:uncharacterized membrane protein